MRCLNIDSDLVFIVYSALLPNLSPELVSSLGLDYRHSLPSQYQVNLESIFVLRVSVPIAFPTLYYNWIPNFGSQSQYNPNPNISSFTLPSTLNLSSATLGSG